MRNATMGLKSLLHAIPSKYIIRLLYKRYVPTLNIDWTVSKRKFDETLVKATSNLKETSFGEWNELTSHLDDICLICADKKTPDRLAAAMRDLTKIEQFNSFFSAEKNTLQNVVCWLLLNEHELWYQLLAAAMAVKIHTKNSQRFFLTSSPRPDNSKLNELETHISTLLFNELGHGNKVHFEFFEDGNCWLYFLSVNKYPVNVQHFDDEGRYILAHDKTAENFLVEYSSTLGTLQIRCDYPISIRRSIAENFSHILLKAKIVEQKRQNYDLSRFLRDQNLASIHNPKVIKADFVGISVVFVNDCGSLDSLHIATKGDTNIHERLHKALSVFEVLPTDTTVTEVIYRLTFCTNEGLRNIKLTLKPDGFRINTRDRTCLALVEEFLREVFT